MGTGDFICITMTGGAPWGFRLQGGKEEKQPLQIAKVGQKNCIYPCLEAGKSVSDRGLSGGSSFSNFQVLMLTSFSILFKNLQHHNVSLESVGFHFKKTKISSDLLSWSLGKYKGILYLH